MKIGHSVAEWEEAVANRPEIEFRELIIRNGVVTTAMGSITCQSRRKTDGEVVYRNRRARWNIEGQFINPNGTSADMDKYNIIFND